MSEEQNKYQLPKGWKLAKLGEACVFSQGIQVDMHKQSLDKKNGLVRFLRIIDFTQDDEPERYIDHPGEKYFLKKDEIAMVRYGTVGFVCTGKEGVIANNLFKIKPNQELSKKYLINFLNSYLFKGKLKTKGATMQALSFGMINPIPIPIPPPSEQQAIVSKIEELFSELDKGIENLHTAQQQLKTYRQSVLKWAFEGKLTEEWRKQKKNLISPKDLLKKIQAEKEKIAKGSNKKTKPLAPLAEDVLEELFEIPKEWAWVKNEEYLFEVKDGTHDTPKYFDSGISFVTQKNIREQGLNFADIQFISEEDHTKFYQRSNAAKGDILISMIGHNRGMTAIVDTDKIFSIKNVGLLKFLPYLQSNKFSFYYYQSRVGLNIVLRKSKGGAQPFIGLTELRNWPVVVCSFEEQNEIVQVIESRLSVADKMEESINQSLQQAEALRQSILKKAFEGSLV
jgi:type I restriction enzyme S subunit